MNSENTFSVRERDAVAVRKQDPAYGFLRLVYSFGHLISGPESVPFVPWDLEPVKLPLLETWTAAIEALHALDRRVKQMPDGYRKDFLASHVRHLKIASRLGQGEKVSLPEQVRDLVQCPFRPAGQREIEELQEDILRLLGKRGFRGYGPEATVAWERSFRLASSEVLRSAKSLAVQARKETIRKVMDLPAGERLTFKTHRHKPWSGYCWYRNQFRSIVGINLDYEWSLPYMRDLVAHELYPGHHTHQVRKEMLYWSGGLPREAALSLLSGPTGAHEEGLAECGLPLLQWNRTMDDSILEKVIRLRNAVGVNVAIMCVHKGASRKEGIQYSIEAGFMDKKRAARGMGFATRRWFAPYTFCYWYGAGIIREALARAEGEKRERVLQVLYGRPLTYEMLVRGLREAVA